MKNCLNRNAEKKFTASRVDDVNWNRFGETVCCARVYTTRWYYTYAVYRCILSAARYYIIVDDDNNNITIIYYNTLLYYLYNIII